MSTDAIVQLPVTSRIYLKLPLLWLCDGISSIVNVWLATLVVTVASWLWFNEPPFFWYVYLYVYLCVCVCMCVDMSACLCTLWFLCRVFSWFLGLYYKFMLFLFFLCVFFCKATHTTSQTLTVVAHHIYAYQSQKIKNKQVQAINQEMK